MPRRCVAAELEEKGAEAGLDDSVGRMISRAEADRAAGDLSAAQIEAIVEGTDDVLDFLADTTWPKAVP